MRCVFMLKWPALLVCKVSKTATGTMAVFFSVQRLRSFRQVVQHACKSVAYEQIRLIDANTSSIFRR